MEPVPQAVFVIWGVTLAVTLLLFVPVSVYLLHKLWRTTLAIDMYARETLAAAAGIAGHVQAIAALDGLVGTASEVLAAAEAAAAKLEALAGRLEERAAG
jgi:hypothetical protein